ncbi:MAG: citrate/2-methylcitrate synthase [Verrucomicrobia bacterium]|jgi:citrate synthase|nr:citrate/2-methylcitrate synthase [Verrucomicrobiota bacterium]MBT7065596.1 citrate/2-methylcitrate synthase [Verrucomicrobiota bacterium]MBT7702322.1 citrate/2-methylcitrate synthase [Verrucomicrobiota bacterium]
METRTDKITEIVLKAARKARRETSSAPQQEGRGRANWPLDCTVGPGLEGAIACETKIGFVNGTRGELTYCGYDIFDLCAYSTFEEVSYLLLYGRMPTAKQFASFKRKLVKSRSLPHTLRLLMGFPLEQMHPMACLRLGTNLMRQRLTWQDSDAARPDSVAAIAADEDSIPMETIPKGEQKAIYEFKKRKTERPAKVPEGTEDAAGLAACIRLISGLSTIAAAVARVRDHKLPIEPDPELGHAANYLYMMNGVRPTPEQERIMDIALILHADHGMNASTFASMVVASTLSDIYFSIGSGIAALSGPLHGGANEAVLVMLEKIGHPDNVDAWFDKAMRRKKKIMGMGHRVYKTYDPRARILGPLASYVARDNPDAALLLRIARKLEKRVVESLGKEKNIFPNVDYYSGIVYKAMGIHRNMFTPVFAVSRVAGWTARVHEYLKKNRIFRPRALYVGAFGKEYKPLDERGRGKTTSR